MNDSRYVNSLWPAVLLEMSVILSPVLVVAAILFCVVRVVRVEQRVGDALLAPRIVHNPDGTTELHPAPIFDQ